MQRLNLIFSLNHCILRWKQNARQINLILLLKLNRFKVRLWKPTLILIIWIDSDRIQWLEVKRLWKSSTDCCRWFTVHIVGFDDLLLRWDDLWRVVERCAGGGDNLNLRLAWHFYRLWLVYTLDLGKIVRDLLRPWLKISRAGGWLNLREVTWDSWDRKELKRVV